MRVRMLFAAAAALLVVVGAANPAAAAGTATVSIGSSAAVGVQTDFENPRWSNHYSNIRVVGNFTNHTATSVKLTSIKVCYSDGQGKRVLISPWITNSRGTFDVDWQAATYLPSQCATYTHARTLSKQPDGEMMRVILRITMEDRSTTSTISGFYR
ncbi:hypothetical protein AB0B03_05120 [Micromonospora chalcea]|uniref:hypothetical protein n=1 Tax=Micromonospora sp. TSRI0369 TaxID=1703936 RepID=UPI000939E741|nr:hypothetical protein [Micromonospora sp. TSRI0369]OKJ47437.1 hypothetical protein AMK25_02065 [Micromonospora sp. TSRI0369]